ncbi:tungstate transport system ATP-binding protein [Candidatus Magnetomoraceae bacterium gMMP-13]
MDRIYQIHNLKHCYNDNPVLSIDNLSIKTSSIVGLIGPNGSGKSTLLKLLSFVEKPSNGNILFKGRQEKLFSDAVRFQVTLLNQEAYLMKRSVFENISYGLKIRGNSRHSYKNKVKKALSWVGLPYENFAHRKWYELSGGEAQRVALAARLVLRPKVLLLDEPSASVDAASAHLIKNASIRARNEWGTTLLIASHDWQWLHGICDNILHLFKGRIFGNGMKNIIFGPWHPGQNSKWVKFLQDGQQIIVSKPPDPDSVAIIEPESINFMPESENTSCKNALYGIITRLILENSTNYILALIRVENINFIAKLTQKKLTKLKLYPGQRVCLSYSESIKWI